MPPQLWLLGASEFSADGVDDFTKSQMWDCMDERDEILGRCRWQMHASDMLALLPALERANLDMDFTDALAELFPDCEALLFQNTGKLVRARDVRAHGLSGADRYIRFGLHARFFNVEGTDDMVVDTLGMGTLFMPDLQYHFHSLDPNWLVHHACSTALYILENDCPIKSGEIIDGVEAETGRISRSVPWRCRYEQALIQPAREVLDIEAGEFASGPRER